MKIGRARRPRGSCILRGNHVVAASPRSSRSPSSARVRAAAPRSASTHRGEAGDGGGSSQARAAANVDRGGSAARSIPRRGEQTRLAVMPNQPFERGIAARHVHRAWRSWRGGAGQHAHQHRRHAARRSGIEPGADGKADHRYAGRDIGDSQRALRSGTGSSGCRCRGRTQGVQRDAAATDHAMPTVARRTDPLSPPRCLLRRCRRQGVVSGHSRVRRRDGIIHTDNGARHGFDPQLPAACAPDRSIPPSCMRRPTWPAGVSLESPRCGIPLYDGDAEATDGSRRRSRR